MSVAQLKKQRTLTDSEANEILSMAPNDITEQTFIDMFANTQKFDAKYLTYDELTIPKGVLFNDMAIKTTIGRVMFNLFVLEYDLIKTIGFQNHAMSGGGLKDMTANLDKLLLEDKIAPIRYIKVLDKLDFMYSFVKFLGPSLTLDLVKPTPKAQALKEELVAKNKKALSEGDFITMNDIEKQVLDVAVQEAKSIPDFEIYESGATGKINNSFKNSTYFRGTIRNLADSELYNVSTESLLDGIPPEEMYLYADIIVQAAHGRAIGTRQGGYEYKKIAAALQGIILDAKGSDCGTTKYKETIITKELTSMIKYRYIIEGDQLVLLTPDNIKNYIGKKVKLRSPMYCTNDKYCSKCSGELFYMIDGLENVGLIANRVGTALLNESLKAFHDLSLKIVDIEIEDYIE